MPDKEKPIEMNAELVNILAETLKEKFQFTTTRELDLAVAEILKRTADKQKDKIGIPFTQMIRGLRLMAGHPAINDHTKDADVACVKALSPGTTPGSYLVPTIQADEIIEYLNIGGVARNMGVRIWPMDGVQAINVPVALAAPSWIWTAVNSQQTATDPNLGQMQFNLKERRALVAIPNQLLKVSVPAFDTLVAELLGLGAAEHEDTAFFASTQVAGGPLNMASAAITTLLAQNNNANGGTLSYTDILAVMSASASAKAKGPFVWAMSPRTWYTRIMGLADSNSRPIFLQGNANTEGLQADVPTGTATSVGRLMGWPVYVTPFISQVEANGSGTNQSHLFFLNPKYAHIAQDGAIQLAVSTERFFDYNQTGVRAVN